MQSRSLALALLLGVVPLAVAQKPSPDLTIRSRAILAKHCAECHGDKPIRGDLKVMDYGEMTKHRRVVFIQPKDPTASQVLELIEEGSMPPGKNAKVPPEEVAVLREWVSSGAPAYPIRFDDAFAYEAILANINDKNTDPDDVPFYRYLTLHHLADAPEGVLTAARSKFLEGVRSVLKPGATGPRSVDATATIFRIDLRDGGWDLKPFIKLNDKGEENGSAKGNIFDVVLLEYPHAVLPVGSRVFAELAQKFLRPADQIRPVPFVRGDWFVDAVTMAPLADDLRKLIALGAEVPPELRKSKAPSVTAMASLGAIPMVDSWYGSDPAGEPAVKGLKVETVEDQVKGLKVETIDFSRNERRDKFKPGERFRLRISADEDMHFEVIWVDSKGKVDTRLPVEKYKRGKPWETPLPVEGELSDEEFGQERIMVFASARKEFVAAEVWRERTTRIERIVHPFFKLKSDAGGLVPDLTDATVTRRTATITILDPKKK